MYKQEYIEVSIQPCTDSFYFCFLVFEMTKFGFCRMLKQQQKTSVKITTYKTDFESQTNIFWLSYITLKDKHQPNKIITYAHTAK